MVKLTGRYRIAVLVLVVGAFAGLLWFLLGPMKSRVREAAQVEVSGGGASVDDVGRAVWEMGENDVVIGVDVGGAIPGLGGAFAGASLIPLPEGMGEVAWEVERGDGGIVVLGEGLWRGHRVEVGWRFVEGDPQSRLRVVVRDVPVSELLGGDVVGRVDVGRAAGWYFDAQMQVGEGGAGDVAWAQWEEGEQVLTLSGVVADGAVLLAGEAGVLEVAFWRGGGLDGVVLGCVENGEKKVDLVVQMDWTVGKALPVVVAGLPHGYRAALVPVFGDLGTSENLAMRAGAARGVEDWLGRARTLIYGHSSMEDPRYGNGGLLGANFGGSVVVPGAWWGDSAVQGLASELEGTRVELVSDGKGASGDGAVYLGGEEVCEQAVLASGAGASLMIVPGAADVVEARVGRVGNVRGGAAAMVQAMGAVALDGRRASLVDGVFGQQALEGLLAARGVSVVSTPLVATRNPLIELWHEAILEPERGGEWTLQSDISRAFARGELFRETERLLVSSASGLQDYWRARARVDVWQGPGGELVFYNGGEDGVAGFTVAIAGEARLVDEADARLQGVELVSRAGVSFLWMDLEAGARRAVYLEGVERMGGVRWE